MRRLCTSLGYGFLMVLVSCSEQVDIPQENTPIMLQASIGEVENSSRVAASPFRGKYPTTEQPLDAAVWFSLTSEKYGNNSSNVLPCHTTITFTDDTPQPAKYDGIGLVYPTPTEGETEGANVYCVGFHPAADWQSVDDNQYAEHEIDGVKDLMFAPRIEGNWNSHFQGQKYQHLLTWLKINVCATNMDAADTWGNIEEITITSRKKVKIKLSDGSFTYTEDIVPISVFKAGEGGAESEAIPLKIAMQEVGSVLCSPPSATRKIMNDDGTETFENEYVVTIKTDKIEEKKELYVDLNLANVQQAAGKLYVLTFYFKPFRLVE